MELNQRIIPLLGLSLVLALSSCSLGTADQKKNNEEEDKSEFNTDNRSKVDLLTSADPVFENGELKVYPAKIGQEFPDAKLILEAPNVADVRTAGEYKFKFRVKNYQLAEQTPMADMRHCANSNKGQHIHFILNNAPYVAQYESDFNENVMEGNNVVLAFLSRSYHESIKNGSAFVLKNFKIGNSTDDFDATSPHLFYSRPKGTYEGKDTKKILLDFYLVNSKLSKEGNKVKVSIDKNEFTLDSWEAYFVEGLSMGQHTFRIQLLDLSGNPVPGPFNDSGNREIELK